VPCGCIGLPLRYMHSPVEMVDLADVDAAARVIAASARRLAADASFLR
jgi:endoglucanase